MVSRFITAGDGVNGQELRHLARWRRGIARCDGGVSRELDWGLFTKTHLEVAMVVGGFDGDVD